MTAIGTLVAESLGLGTEVTTPLTIRRLTRIGAWSRDGDQPAHWTLIDFTCPDENADRLAAELASALLPDRWYTDFATETTKYVVFAGTTYRFARGDSEGNAQAVAHARQIGVPEAQLDWSP